MRANRRKIELVVLSDIHLGTYGCHAKELNNYLKSIQPKHLILNGDIIDIWQFSKRYWPKSHMKVVKQILNLSTKGTQVTYLTGNHDETLRKFDGLEMGNFQIKNKLELEIDGKKAWFFHGDVFDVIIEHSKWLAKLGAISYDLLILVNVVANRIMQVFGKKKISISKKIKDNVKTAVKYIGNFEDTAAQVAIKKGFDYIICGHIHNPKDRIVKSPKGNSIRYLNSGDWVENLSALEYNNGAWEIFLYQHEKFELKQELHFDLDEDMLLTEMNSKAIFKKMLSEF